jgi:hypothetical protein
MFKVAFALVALLVCFAAGGCDHGIPGLVSVSGKLTYAGGKWPKTGEILFSRDQGAGKVLPAMAKINEDGTFVVMSSNSTGIAPGDYTAVIRCWLEAPNERRHESKSAVPARYSSAQTSPLKLKVPESSPPIRLDWDVPST